MNQNESQQCLDELRDFCYQNIWRISSFLVGMPRTRQSYADQEEEQKEQLLVNILLDWKLKPCISIILRTEVGINISWTTYFPDPGWGWGLSYGLSMVLDFLWVGNIVWNISYCKYCFGEGNIVSLVTQWNIPFYPPNAYFFPQNKFAIPSPKDSYKEFKLHNLKFTETTLFIKYLHKPQRDSWNLQ